MLSFFFLKKIDWTKIQVFIPVRAKIKSCYPPGSCLAYAKALRGLWAPPVWEGIQPQLLKPWMTALTMRHLKAESKKQPRSCTFPRQVKGSEFFWNLLSNSSQAQGKFLLWSSTEHMPSPGLVSLVQVGEQPNPTSYPESCAGEFSPEQRETLVCSNQPFPHTLKLLNSLQRWVKATTFPPQSNFWSRAQQPASLSTPSICRQCHRWKDGDLPPYQFAIKFFSAAPLCSTLFYFPVMVSDWEKTG